MNMLSSTTNQVVEFHVRIAVRTMLLGACISYLHYVYIDGGDDGEGLGTIRALAITLTLRYSAGV